MRFALLLVAAVAFGAGCDSALAFDKDDWIDCNGGAPDIAIPACTRVAAVPGEEPSLVARAYLNRGDAHHHNLEFEDAANDYTRSWLLTPSDPGPLFRRGIASFYAGHFLSAEPDMRRAAEMNPEAAYPQLWLHIMAAENDHASPLANAVPRLDMTAWPAPVVRLFLGEATADEVLAAAANADADVNRGQVCEANFYIGEQALIERKVEEARKHFQLAADDCVPNFIELDAARAELGTLGAQ